MAELLHAPRVIRIVDDRPRIAVDEWRRLSDEDPLPEMEGIPVLVSPARLESERDQLEARAGAFGIWVPGEAEPEEVAALAAELPVDLAVVAIEVPRFTDGRHYTLARLLRERFGYTGELRAFGDVLPDQLFYMRRCGYDTFELKPGKSLATGLQTLSAFSVTYQGAADDSRPLYRRR